MTVEIDWTLPPQTTPLRPSTEPPLPPAPASSTPAELSIPGGKILGAIAWPPGSGLVPVERPDGAWTLGPAGRGRVRARVEAVLGAELEIKVGGQTTRVPLIALLDGPQRTASGLGVDVGMERPSWDAIAAELGPEGSDGVFEPGAPVPITASFNILASEPGDVTLRCSAELTPIRGGEPIWRQDWQTVGDTNALTQPRHALTMTAPSVEGTYVLEIKATWESLADKPGNRLSRIVRRRRGGGIASSASRRLTLAVVADRPPATAPPARGDGAAVEVDAIDLARAKGHRPSAAGRSSLEGAGRWSWPVPESALIEAPLRDRLRGWINRGGVEHAVLAAADGSGLAWSAVGLRVAHPDRPHRLTLTVSAGHPSALGVALVAGGGAGGRGRVVLDACASGSPIVEGGPTATFSWPVWPDSETPVLVLVNRNATAPVQVGPIVLTELAELPPAGVVRGAERSLGLHLESPRALDRFGGGGEPGRVDPVIQARNLATYLGHCGASTVVLPDGLADRNRRRLLEGQADEDSTGPDRLELLLRILARKGCTAWVDVAFDANLPGLPPPESPEALADGLARLDRRGLPDGPAYQPLHPRVREAMGKKLAEAIAARNRQPNLAGALVRLGPGSTLPGGADSGLDDATYARFVSSSFEPTLAGRLPGRGTTDAGRFEARARFVEAPGRVSWLAWRSRELARVYADLADTVRHSAPGATLAVATPGLDAGPAGEEARRVDLAGLDASQAWRGVGLDLAVWPSGDGAPLVLRGVGLSTEDLGHDLATSPELDDQVAARPGRGALIGLADAREADPASARGAGPRLRALPIAEGAAGDEPLGHALASLDASRVLVAASSVAGQEERLRRFARIFTSLPAPPLGKAEPRLPSGVVARASRSAAETVVAMANDTPYPILLEAVLTAPEGAAIEDVGRGVQLEPEKGPGTTRLVLELPPFGVAAARVAAPDVRVVSVTPHPGPAVLDGMKAHYDDLGAALARLNRSHDEPGGLVSRGPGPANPSFEPDAVQLATSRPSSGVPGWDSTGEAARSIEVDRDRPHSGRASLRVETKTSPAGIISDPFRPDGRSSLAIRVWMRADRPEARVRIRLDGQSGGRPVARQLDVAARSEWSEVVVRATQLPEEGLDAARLRFELLGPGRLWLDDVSVVGDPLSESERLNARRDLKAALDAYREKRYADFARLAGSHWTRHVASSPPTLAGDRSGVTRTGDASSSSLPPGRKLR
jgi:hypothetical protein